MFAFKNDYSEGCHPQILEALAAANLQKSAVYGEDEYCEKARRCIQQLAGTAAGVHFFAGGTQTNLTFIGHALRPYQAVISAATGHIATHETGAIEATGHKVIALPSAGGKLTVSLVAEALQQHALAPHMVQPKMVYISHPTEVGTLYSPQELEELYRFCQKKDLLLYLDGARLASALAAQPKELPLARLAALTDAFYMGGTKCGALFGEALVIVNPTLDAGFRYSIKQRGAMLAKGRLLGLQFYELLRGGLYLQLGQHANQVAAALHSGLAAAGFSFLIESPTNQQFPIFSAAAYQALEQRYPGLSWDTTPEGKTAVRCVTSWATTMQEVEAFTAFCTGLAAV
ncbi:MAG: threonine aldolase family protein [Oscillospiraceae bacterium]